MEIIRITKVLFGLWSTLLLGISGIIVLDERFFRPIECTSRNIQLSALYRGQQPDAVPMKPPVEFGKGIFRSIKQSPFPSIMQSARLSFDHQVYRFLNNDSTHNTMSTHRDPNKDFSASSLEEQSRARNISDFVQRYTAMMWGDRTRLNLQDAVQGSAYELQLGSFAHEERELEYIAQRKKGQLSGARNRSGGVYSRSYTTPVSKKKLKKGIQAKGQLAPKGIQRRKGASQAALDAFANHSRLRGKNRTAQGALPPIVHLKPIAPGATIKPQSAHDAWKKKRQHPIFSWPLDPKDFWVSSLFGPRKKPNGTWALHAGVDLAACRGTPVRASREGRVIKASYSSGYGNYILIEHSKKYQTRYAHLDKILVRVGQSVCAGDYIGRVGSTGFVRKSRWGSSGSHLHFEVYVYGKAKNPFCFLA